MASGQLHDVLDFIRQSVQSAGVENLSDGDLLDGFVSRGDPSAFRALLVRHGGLVLGVCRRLLPPADADDAFQATFLIFLRKARSLTRRHLVGNWLYGVAHRVALKARSLLARRRLRERPLEEDPLPGAARDRSTADWGPILEEEVRGLPDRLRAPVLLCYLEGHTNEEAARVLGWPSGTVKSRLARARDLLRRRLRRRGLVPGVGVAALLAREAAPVVAGPLRDGLLEAAGGPASGQAVSTTATLLAQGVLRAMWMMRAKSLVAVLFLAGAVGLGLSLATTPPARADKPSGAPPAEKQPPAAKERPAPPAAEKKDAPPRPSGEKPAPKPDEETAARIKSLIQQLGDDSFTVREAATKELIKIGRPAVPFLRAALKDKDIEISQRSRKVLDALKQSVVYLTEDLQDSDPGIRKEAAEALEQMGARAKDAVPALVKALKDKDEGVRDAVIMALLAIDPDNKALADAAPAKASVGGKYRKLLRRILVEQDKNGYGEFSDYGHYTGTSYAGYDNLPVGYWVYVYPHWYIWGEMKNK
jgi:RNA polymerase sigma factor (sigma-70 family)